MSEFIEITPEEITKNPFHLIDKEWMLVTAEKPDGTCNTMTASWGGLGIMWSKKVAYVVLRPQRYTKEFVDEAETLSLTFFDKKYKKTLSYLGTVSGRDEDKVKKSELTVNHYDKTPYFDEADMVLICKKSFAQPFNPDSFIDSEIVPKNYPNKDFHTLYIVEIEKVLVKKD